MIDSGRSAPSDAAQPRARRGHAVDGTEPSFDRRFAERYLRFRAAGRGGHDRMVVHDAARLWAQAVQQSGSRRDASA